MVISNLYSNMIPENTRLVVDTYNFFPGFGEADVTGAANNVDIWEGPTASEPEPDTGGFELWVESDDVGDAIAGVGIQKVEIHYLDTAGVMQQVNVNMAGTTPVDSGVSDCMFVNDLHATQVGSTGLSIGNVDATSGTGGAVVSRIGPSGNRALSTMKQVPAGYNLIVTGWYAAGVATTVKIATLRLRTTQHNGASIPGVYHYLSTARVKDNSSPWIPLNYRINPLATIKVSAWTTGTISVSAHWNGYLEKI